MSGRVAGMHVAIGGREFCIPLVETNVDSEWRGPDAEVRAPRGPAAAAFMGAMAEHAGSGLPKHSVSFPITEGTMFRGKISGMETDGDLLRMDLVGGVAPNPMRE